MEQLDNFWESVKKEETSLLATSAGGNVTMRTVSPAYYKDAILIFTSPASMKYQQLKENPNCCIAVGGCFMEAKAQFLGRTMLDENASYRDVYSAKYTGAFDESENAAFGGRDADFILLKPVKVKGWGFDNGAPTGPFEHSF